MWDTTTTASTSFSILTTFFLCAKFYCCASKLFVIMVWFFFLLSFRWTFCFAISLSGPFASLLSLWESIGVGDCLLYIFYEIVGVLIRVRWNFLPHFVSLHVFAFMIMNSFSFSFFAISNIFLLMFNCSSTFRSQLNWIEFYFGGRWRAERALIAIPVAHRQYVYWAKLFVMYGFVFWGIKNVSQIKRTITIILIKTSASDEEWEKCDMTWLMKWESCWKWAIS